MYPLITSFCIVSLNASIHFFIRIVTPETHWLCKKILSKHFEPTVSEPIIKQKLYVSIPYFGSHFDSLANELCVLLLKFIPHYDFALIQADRNKCCSLLNYKDSFASPLAFFSGL